MTVLVTNDGVIIIDCDGQLTRECYQWQPRTLWLDVNQTYKAPPPPKENRNDANLEATA